MSKQRLIIFLSIFIGFFGEVVAQELRQLEIVGKPEKLTAEIASRRDNDGNMAAAIQVVSDLDGFSYDAFNGVVGNVDSRPGMDIVYLQTTERVLEIYKTGFEPLKVILSEVGIRLQAREVWKLTITGEAIQEVQSVVIRYQPEDADLYLDGELMTKAGTYPLTLGAHELRIEKDGYQAIAEQIVVDEQHILFEYELEKQPDALVEITTTPAGAKVYLDGVQLGETPVAVYYKAGRYSLRIFREGYVDIDNEQFEVELPTTRKNYTLEENVGYLTVNTHENAIVSINGSIINERKNIKLPPQVLRIKVSVPKAEPLEQQLVLNRNDRLNIDLYPEVQVASLQLAVAPFDAQVLLEGDAGERYTAVGSKVFEEIPVGTYIIRVSAARHETKEETVLLKSGERESRSLRLSEHRAAQSPVAAASTSTIFGTVYNPKTGKTWMNRNLGASRVATHSTDEAAYGDLYQWGRGTDGHEKRTSGITRAPSHTDIPGHDNFIRVRRSPYDWRKLKNDNLWQGVDGTNNPCPPGYRVPTAAEWEAEHQSWSSSDADGAFHSPLKLPVAGYRNDINGSVSGVGFSGYYWSATVVAANARHLSFYSSNAEMNIYGRANGYSIRCIKN